VVAYVCAYTDGLWEWARWHVLIASSRSSEELCGI
jgi:hypothetical protein